MIRMLRYCGVALAALSLGLGPALAQSTSADAPPHENWASGCSAASRGAPLDCSIVQRVIDSKSGRLLAMVRIRVPGETQSPVMLIQMPLGVYLPAELSLGVDGAAQAKVAFQTCDQTGCYAGTPVSNGLLTAMLKGQSLSLTVQDRTHKDTSIPISLIGFAKAYSQIK